MKKLFLSFVMLFMSVLPAQADEHMHGDMAADLTAVVYYADWCGSCKILDPAMKEAMAMDGFPAVDVVMMDLTDDATKATSKDMAEQKGLESFYNADGKTGFVLIIDSETKQPLAKLTKANDAGEIAAIVKAVSARS